MASQLQELLVNVPGLGPEPRALRAERIQEALRLLQVAEEAWDGDAATLEIGEAQLAHALRTYATIPGALVNDGTAAGLTAVLLKARRGPRAFEDRRLPTAERYVLWRAAGIITPKDP